MEILKVIDSKKLHRKVDRVSLKKTNKIYKEAALHSTADSAIIEETVKMKRLVKSWKNNSNKTEVAKLFRLLLENNGKLLSTEVKKILDTKATTYYTTLTQQNHKTNWNVIFSKDDTFHYINKEAIEYYNSLN